MTPKPVLQHRCTLGEGPVWDDRGQCLYWVDILEGVIHRYDVANGQYSNFWVGQMVGSIVLRETGGLVAALQNGFHLIDMEAGGIRQIIDPEAALQNNRFNEGKCDPQGRFWAGTMNLNDVPNQGSLYQLDADGSVQQKISGVSISNGLAWSLDGRTMYYIDTLAFCVMAYDFEAVTGNISNGRRLIELPEISYGHSDGMTIDSEGMLWIAHWDGWKISRWNPADSSLQQTVPIPVARVTSCTFGGPRLQDLYITSASVGLTVGQIAEQPLAGCLFVIKDCGFSGSKTFRYGG